MEKKNLIYPFVDTSIEQLELVSNKIEVKEIEGNIEFYSNNKKIIEDDNLCIGMLSYIKFLGTLSINYENENKEEYINSIVIKIKDDIINRIVDLKDVGEDVLFNKLELKEDHILMILLKNIIKAYEIELDVEKTENPKIYTPIKDKCNDSMSMQKEKILELVKTTSK